MIRSGVSVSEKEQMSAVSIAAEREFDSLLDATDSALRDLIIADVLDSLISQKRAPTSLIAAQQLTRQGVVLIWSAFEVLARDSFVILLNQRPDLSEALLAEPSNRKRFGTERVEWETLVAFGFNLSKRLGDYLVGKHDLNSILAIRGAYKALFPSTSELHVHLSDQRLWDLSQQRNLIVHRAGVVDQQYMASTTNPPAMGAVLTVSPATVASMMRSVQQAGKQMILAVGAAMEEAAT